ANLSLAGGLHEQRRTTAGIGRSGRTLRVRDIARRGDKRLELTVGDFVGLDAEGSDMDRRRRFLFGIDRLVALHEAALRHGDKRTDLVRGQTTDRRGRARTARRKQSRKEDRAPHLPATSLSTV